jgi:hypothetical protein
MAIISIKLSVISKLRLNLLKFITLSFPKTKVFDRAHLIKIILLVSEYSPTFN